MAKLTSLFQFSGSLDGFTVYTMEGVDCPIVRKKGGPTKEKIQTAPSSANTRRTGKEFGGRSTTAKLLREAFLSLGTFIDGSCIGRLNKLLIPVQALDTQSAWGQRGVALSQKPQLLEGFELSRPRPFDAVIQNPINYTLSKDGGTARLEVPTLIPGMNFTPRIGYSYFRIIAVLGAVPDVQYQKEMDDYIPAERFAGVLAREAQTGWLVVKGGAPATTLELELPHKPTGSGYSLVLAVGITFGNMGASGTIEGVKRTGSAKILAVV